MATESRFASASKVQVHFVDFFVVGDLKADAEATADESCGEGCVEHLEGGVGCFGIFFGGRSLGLKRQAKKNREEQERKERSDGQIRRWSRAFARKKQGWLR